MALNKSLEKAKTNTINPLKKIQLFQEGAIDFFIASLAAITHNIIVQGAENELSNPFYKIKSNKIDIELIKAMAKFQKSPERITKTNKIFADLISEYCSPDTLPIFIGGAAHPITLFHGEELFDPGLQGRIPNSVSLYLLDFPEPIFQKKAPYEYAARKLHGQYDYQIETNKKTLYKETFSSLPQLIDKIDFLTMTMNNLIRGHLSFTKNFHLVLREDVQIILTAFQESIREKIQFISFNNIIEQVAAVKLLQESKHGFFSSKKLKEPDSLKHMIIMAIYEDLADIIKDEKIQEITPQ